MHATHELPSRALSLPCAQTHRFCLSTEPYAVLPVHDWPPSVDFSAEVWNSRHTSISAASSVGSCSVHGMPCLSCGAVSSEQYAVAQLAPSCAA